jgi:diguanylate cyclase (GGDEF)-like protein
VLTGMSRNRMLPRCALAGLVFGFVILAVGGLVAVRTTRQAIETVESTDRITAAWNRTFVFVNQETEAMNDYLRARDDAGLQVLNSQIASAQPTITWLDLHSSTAGARRVRLVKDGYQDFTGLLRELVAAAGAGHQTEVGELADQAGLSAGGLRKLVSANLTFQRSRLNVDLAVVGGNSDRLYDIGVYVIAADAVLLVICAGLLLGYQRRVERHAANSRHQASHDPLTGLANRRLLNDELNRVVRDAAELGEPAALLLLDLDGFKGVNDTQGHQTGDALLQHVATRLTGVVRRSDLVARLGGDEFAVLLPGTHAVDEVRTIATTILDEIRRPIELGETTAAVSASIGVAFCPDDTTDHEQLFRYADTAMYTAKRGGLGVTFHGEGRPTVRPVEQAVAAP